MLTVRPSFCKRQLLVRPTMEASPTRAQAVDFGHLEENYDLTVVIEVIARVERQPQGE